MSDIRQLLEAAKADPPPPPTTVDDIVRAGRRRLRKSRASVAGLGIAAVATALLVATTITPATAPTLDTAANAPAPATTSFTLTYAGYRVGPFQVTDPIQVTPGYQQSLVRRLDNQNVGTLTVYARGVFRTDRFAAGTGIQVDGRPGYAVRLDRVLTFGAARARGATTSTVVKLPAIAWQYADDAWATLTSDDPDTRGLPADALRRLADAFTLSKARPATTAFRIKTMPPGWELAAVGRSLVGGDTAVSAATWVRSGTRFDALTEPLDLTRTPSIVVRVSPVETEGPYAHPVSPACLTGQHFCDVPIDGRFYAEVYDASGTVPGDEIAKIAQSLEFAVPARPDSWFPTS
jgi:hypothetical protein